MTSTLVPRDDRRLAAGAALTAAGATVAYLASFAVPAVGVLTTAIVTGVVVGNLPRVPASVQAGVSWWTRRLLRVGVVLLGLQLALPQVLGLGPGVLGAVLLTVVAGFLGTRCLGRLLGVPRGLTTLVAAGFSICGASAIAATEGVIKRRDSDVAAAVALVTLYGALAMVAVPLLAPVVGLVGPEVGKWAGLSVHEVGQVVVAASPAGAAAVATAAVVKLSRVVLLAPLVAILSVGARPRRGASSWERVPVIPLFVVGFLAAVLVRSAGVLPGNVLAAAQFVTVLLLAGGLFGLGCATRLPALRGTGGRALLLGLLSTLLIGLVALAALVALA